jgi:hypothetical protein
MLSSKTTKSNLEKYGLAVMTTAWEDTSRFKNSCLGNNITDMTLKVKDKNVNEPIIRTPNFKDVSSDIPIKNFVLFDGEKRVTLEEYIKGRNFLAPRDTHILSSAQCCILPNNSDFCVEMFNYQSTRENPAVLVILATDSGITEHVLTESGTGVFKLLFNIRGQQSYLHIDNKCENGAVKTSHSELNIKERSKNLIRVFQIPLEIPQSQQRYINPCGFESCLESYSSRGLTMGQISVGSVYGKYTPPKANLKRDHSMPIRCTFQYYRVGSATDYIVGVADSRVHRVNDNISEVEAEDISAQLRRMSVVETAHSSLVVSRDSTRPTESDGKHFAPKDDINDTEFALQ